MRVQIKVAFAAGLPKTLEALLELFAPENDWQENCEFRAGLEKHLGMPPKGGMSILPTFIATTANPESMELAAAYFSGGPAALLGVVGEDDPSALPWPEPGAPSAAKTGKRTAQRDQSPAPPPSKPSRMMQTLTGQKLLGFRAEGIRVIGACLVGYLSECAPNMTIWPFTF